ncbi:FAD-dependent oxidoreductase [Actinopolyspora erythraea]|uniref:FAD-dependent oxidoreductase n=1 Tax=Actinopolyspora erythraea TaxID=414996 RepID=A0A099D9G9_9ACTN|nr:FAD-dependent oxidoreductase [Actinopolyspora erythraea]ASU80501.1 FAD-dependent oxidoreductase [Actinopolyspora erythraea]KGI82828.1 pyridine nucleotide-disulfide oxidoreductase [Actinopolyspora erythraea]
MSETFVVVGGGLAGAKTVEALRERDFSGRIELICEEESPPYERPPLSKEYLAGRAEVSDLTVHPREWYSEHDVELRLGTRATGVHPGSHEVELADATRLGYDKLVLATGSRPRRLPLPGADSRGVHCLRRLGDADRLAATLRRVDRLVIVGAGWIGLEVAAVAREYGVGVHVVEAAHQPLLEALGPRMGEFFAELHREHGVELHLSARVAEVLTSSGVTGVRLTDGSELPADAVLLAVGARPELTLAETAGLDVDNGVLVDTGLTTSDPDILAVGDIADLRHPTFGRLRVEHWANALKQPAVAAATMLGHSASFTELPYFFTDQYDLGMEYHGFVPGEVEDRVVVRGSLADRRFVACWLDGSDRVLAAMNVNVFGQNERIRTLIHSGASVVPERLADTTYSLDDVDALRKRPVGSA